jgi:hypothetical protein
MRYQSARVVLGACLIAATAAAQAPASISNSEATRGSGLVERAPGERIALGSALRVGDDRIVSDRFGGSLLGSDAERAAALAQSVEAQAQQGDPDYSLYGQFRLHHGEFMDLRERFRPQIDIRGRLFPNQRIDDEPGSFDQYGYELDAKIPVFISTEAYLTFGGYYLGRRYVTSSQFGTAGNASGIGDETLVGAGATLGFGVFLEDNWLFEAETRPGVWSDLDDTLHHEDFDFPSSAMFTFRPMDNFFFKFGARYNQVYEDAPWLPLVGFSWEVVEGFRIDILAPEHAELSWWPSSSFGVLFGAEVTGAEYHVHTSEAVNQRDDLRVQEAVGYLGLVSRMNDHASFMARAGIVVAGDYDLTTGATGFNRSEGALDQGFFAEVSFGLSF